MSESDTLIEEFMSDIPPDIPVSLPAQIQPPPYTAVARPPVQVSPAEQRANSLNELTSLYDLLKSVSPEEAANYDYTSMRIDPQRYIDMIHRRLAVHVYKIYIENALSSLGGANLLEVLIIKSLMAETIISSSSSIIPNPKMMLLGVVFLGLFLKGGGKLKDFIGHLQRKTDKLEQPNDIDAQEKFFLALSTPMAD